MISIKIQKSIKCQDNYSLFISFPYDQKIIDIIRAFPIRYWNPENKEWELPLKKLQTLVNQLQDQDFDITGEYIQVSKPEIQCLPNFKFKTKPYDHQVDGFNYGLTNNRWLLGDEQGLGKTKQVIDIAVAKKQTLGYKHCLIICGVNGLKWNWFNEVKTHSDEQGYVIGQRRRGNKLVVDSNAAKLEDLNNLDTLPYFIITNVESLRYKVPTGKMVKVRGKMVKEYEYPITDKLVELCGNGSINMIAFDELHKCKNPDSDQGSQILRLQTDTMIGMTGTPLMNTPLDLYIIFKWLGYEDHTFYSFKMHYCEFGGFGGHEIVGYKNLNQLQGRLEEIMLRRLKDEVLDLPEKTYINEYVELTDKQAKIYKEVTAEIKDNIDNIKMVNNPLAELIRMRQATGYTGILSTTIQESAKFDRMVEIVEEAITNNKKVVIFSNWEQMIIPAKDRLGKYNPAIITGKIKPDVRQEMINKFQHDPKCHVILGTIGAMGTGLTLTEGTVEIFLDEPWNKALKDQAEDRCHRIGQKNNVTIYTLLAKDTIDERINEIVYKKGIMSDTIVDGKVIGDKTELLNFLIG